MDDVKKPNKPATKDTELTDPGPESLQELPEQDFAGAVRPNRYANLRGDFERAVFLDRDLWDHFGSEQRVVEALRLLVDLAKRKSA